MLNEIKVNIINYFTNLSDKLKVPSGYHQINIYFNKNDLYIDLGCISILKSINKMIPYIHDNYMSIMKDITLLIRKQKESFIDYILSDLEISKNYVNIIYTKIVNYLNPMIFPIEILKLIIEYLNEYDKLNLADSLNFYNYEYLLKSVFDNKIILSNNVAIYKRDVIEKKNKDLFEIRL